MQALDIRNIFAVEITIDEHIEETIILLGDNGKEPSSKKISDLVLPKIRNAVHPGSTFEVNDIYSIEVGLLKYEQINR
jgi:hypothetical protein